MLFVLKFDKSKFIKDEHSPNIKDIFITFCVLKFDKPKFIKEEQP